METETFRKVFIKSAEDLPPKSGTYLVFVRDDDGIQQWTYSKSSDNDDDDVDWFESIDWYLLPIEPNNDKAVIEKYRIAFDCLRDEVIKFSTPELREQFLKIESEINQIAALKSESKEVEDHSPIDTPFGPSKS